MSENEIIGAIQMATQKINELNLLLKQANERTEKAESTVRDLREFLELTKPKPKLLSD
jgi:hypothetical protein